MLSDRSAVYGRKYHVLYVTPELKKHDETTNTLQGARSILGSFAKLRKATVSFIMSVSLSDRMEQLGSTGRIS
jgi:hypothetical protein